MILHPNMAIALLLLLLLTPTLTYSTHNTTTTTSNSTNINSICNLTPYPKTCLKTLDLSITIGIQPSILSFALQALHGALSSALNLSPLLAAPSGVVETQKGALQDCRELHESTVDSLRRSPALVASSTTWNLADVRSRLAAALTNRATCLEGLQGAQGPGKTTLVSSLESAYETVSNALSLVVRATGGRRRGRRMAESSGRQWPEWLDKKGRRLLSFGNEGVFGRRITVAMDGSGDFGTIGEAVAAAPSKSDERTVIFIRAGVYKENVEVPSYKTNIVFWGEGHGRTVITGERSVGGGWTTFRSATVAVSGRGFLARGIRFVNTAGPSAGQAVALRINADLVALYRCSFDGYQDTLYVHSFRQFYRECNIYGTIDFICGNAAAMLQASSIILKKPLLGQENAVTAQSRDDPDEDTGISIQNCTIIPSRDLKAAKSGTVLSYLGRPWMKYSLTVVMDSYIDGVIDPAGWSKWFGDEGLDTLSYGEYMNRGPGAQTDGRVTWPGVHVMGYDEAFKFSVGEFIYGDEWLGSTSFPYDDGV